ncbi:MAG: hypothetical protein AAF228_13470, partial [Pseudomonadota bacterium]
SYFFKKVEYMDVVQFGANVATALSLIAAIIFGVIGYIQNNKRFRSEYTLGLMQFKFEQDDIFRAYDYMSNLIAEEKDYNRSEVNDKKLAEAVEKLLSYFELISIAYLRHDADRQIIEKQIKSGMRDTYIRCKPYIIERRKELKRPKLYDNLRIVATEHFM